MYMAPELLRNEDFSEKIDVYRYVYTHIHMY